MQGNTVFAVMGYTGEYSGYTLWLNKIFESEYDAKVYLRKLKYKLKELNLNKSSSDWRAGNKALEQIKEEFDPNAQWDWATGTGYYITETNYIPKILTEGYNEN